MRSSKKRKLIAIVLATVLLFSCLSSLPGFAAAGGTFYVSASESASGNEGYYATLAAALEAVRDGGTVEMTANYTAAERVDSVAKSWTLDGKGFTWTANDTTKVGTDTPYCIRLGYNEKTITLKNVTFDYAGNTVGCTRLVQASDKSCDVILSTGTKFTHTGSASLDRGFMKQTSAKLTVDGAVFEIDAPAISTWGAGVHHIVLNSGTLSFGTDPFSGKDFALGNGYQTDSEGSTVTGAGNISVYTGAGTRPLATNDFGLTNATVNLTKAPGAAVVLPENTVAYITIGTSETKYYSLNDAFIAAAGSGDTLTVNGEFAVSSYTLLEKDLTIVGADANAKLVARNANVVTIGNGKLTLKNITVQNKGSSSKESATICFGYSGDGFTGGTLVLDSGAKVMNEAAAVGGNTGGNTIAVLFDGDNKITINDGAYVKGAGSAICSERGKSTITMNGGTVYANYRAINLANAKASFTMNGGTVEFARSKGQQNGTENGAWCICDYGRGAAITLNAGTLIAANGDSCSLIGKSAPNISIGDSVVFKKGTSTLGDINISNNHMYLYIPSDAVDAEDAAMAFAAKVTGTDKIKETGMLIVPEKVLGTDEIKVNGYMVLQVADDSGLTANGYTECGVTEVATGLAAIGGKMCARAYAVVEYDLGGMKFEKVIYGTQMSTDGTELANAYKAQNADWESNATVKTIVETFAALAAN